VRAEVAPLKARQLSRLPSGPARSTTSCSARTSTQLALGHTDRALDLDGPSTPPRITARLDHLQHARPAITRDLGLQP
jgi:hypothetical protein